MAKIFISVGDPSADAHAARLMRVLKARRPDLEFIGLGGPAMQAQGLQSLVPFESLSVVGFWEVVKKYAFFRSVLRRCKKVLQEQRPDLFLPIDFPGFNLRLATFARKLRIPTIYYIAPQLWAWGKQRAQTLANSVDLLLVVFPFEEAFFTQLGVPALYVGHPLLDDPQFAALPRRFEYRDDTIVLMPGSRPQELAHHLPLMLQTAAILASYLPELSFTIVKPETLPLESYMPYFRSYEHLELEFASTASQALQWAKAAIIKAGTSTLEAAVLLTPFVTVYKTSALSYRIGKWLVNVPHITLVNILLQQAVVPEFIQDEAQPKAIAESVLSILTNSEYRSLFLSQFQQLRATLGGAGATETVADVILGRLAQ